MKKIGYTGCDTTSRLHGLGKGTALAKLHYGDQAFKAVSDVFYNSKDIPAQVYAAGESAMCILYGGSDSDKLDDLRYSLFEKKVAKATTFVRPHDLPPTSAAAIHHSLRVYLQVQVWSRPSSSNDRRNPEEWGWTLREGNLRPVTTLLPAAPDCLIRYSAAIKFVRAEKIDSNAQLPAENAKEFIAQMLLLCQQITRIPTLNSVYNVMIKIEFN